MMRYPMIWAQSGRFKATPISISDEWVTFLELPDESLSECILSLGFRRSSVDENKITYGFRGLLSEDQWARIDNQCAITPFNEGDVFYATNGDYRLTPDYSALLFFTSKLYLEDTARYEELCAGVSVATAWDVLSAKEVTADSAGLWSNFITAYCDAEGGSPESFDLMGDIWEKACGLQGLDAGTEIPSKASSAVQASETEDVVIAVAGETVFYGADQSELTGRLAKSIYSHDTTVLIQNSEPMWVEGSPISQNISVPRDAVSLTPGTFNPTVEKFAHPLSLRHSLEELSPDKWGDRRVSGYWCAGVVSMGCDEAYKDDAKTLIRMNEYVRNRVLDETGYPNAALWPTGDSWMVGRVDAEHRLESIHLRTLAYDSVKATPPEPDYVKATDKHLARFHELAESNLRALNRFSEAGVVTNAVITADAIDDHYSEEWIATATNEELAKMLATRMMDLGDEILCSRVMSDLSVRSQLKWAGCILLATEEYTRLEFFVNASGGMVGAISTQANESLSLNRVLASGEVFIGESAQVIVDDYFAGEEEVGGLQAVKNDALFAAKAVDIAKEVMIFALPKDPFWADHGRQCTEYLTAKFKSYSPFAHSTDTWLDRQAARFKPEFMNAAGMVILANKRKFHTEILSEEDIWSKYGGDRDLAYKSVQARLRGIRGFKSASPLILDKLEMLKPELSQSLKDHYRSKVLLAKAASTGEGRAKGERQDKGVVVGFARKDFYALGRVQMSQAIETLDPNKWLDMTKTAAIWPKPKLNKLKEESSSPEAAFVAHITRSCLPQSFRDITADPAMVAQYIDGVREMRSTIHKAGSFNEAVYQATKCLYKLGVEISDNRISYARDCPWMVLGARESRNSRRTLSSYFLAESDDALIENFSQAFECQADPWSFAEPSATSRRQRVERRSLADIPELNNIEREGPEWREGGTVSEEDLIMTFGFSGAEYGNSTNQVERTAYMAYTYDAFADLADITGLPKAALSLGGTLGLTYGSRGRGGKGAALAHFEPANIAIALTRKRGAGSLGHEYFHALANYFARQFSAGSAAGDIAKSIDNILKRDASFNAEFQCFNSGGMRKETFEAFAKLYWTLTHQPENGDWSQIKAADDITQRSLPCQAKWVEESQKQDKEDRRKKTYWAAPEELFARGMEAWVVSTLASAGRKNDYLVRDARISVDNNETFSVYPSGEHLKAIKLAADEFFPAIKLEDKLVHHPIGNEMVLPTMYSRWGSCKRVPKAILAEQALIEIRQMMGDNVALIVTNKLHDQEGLPVSGEWVGPLNAIRISSELANMGTVRHESYHGARQLLMTGEEKGMMDRAFIPMEPAYEALKRTLLAQGKDHLVSVIHHSTEEAQAYAFQLYCQGDLTFEVSPPVQGIFGRMVAALKSIFTVSSGYGCSTPKAVFDALQSGDMLSRHNASELDIEAKDNVVLELA